MFILINEEFTEINDSVIVSELPEEAPPAGWMWVDTNAEVAQSLLGKKARENYSNERAQAYLNAGITIEAMTIALWERVVENRLELSNELQTIRIEIKNRFPKP